MPDKGIPPEVLAEYVEDECPTCGAYILNPALHAQWHEHIQSSLRNLGERADRYKPPPVYGGR